MQADIFYQTTTEKSIPLVLLTKAACADGLPSLTAYEKNCLINQGVKGNLGDIGMIFDNQGHLVHIYVGADDGTKDALAMASVATLLPVGSYSPVEPLSDTASIAWSLAQYQFDKYKKTSLSPRVLVVNQKDLPSVLSFTQAVFLVRDLINTPTNDLGPLELSNVLKNLAEQYGAEFEQWVGDELLRDNFPAIHAVGRAAETAPRLLSMVWGNPKHPRVALVGKGVCFDSGGLDLKPAVDMRLMKKDMAGAAHVIGLAKWLMAEQVPICLHVIIPAVENAIGKDAYRPGDVLTMRNGLSVEIHNTDAEGRLVLADALTKAVEGKPELIIDFATLTGAARVAVGADISAMFVNNDALASELSSASIEVNDPIWRLPLFKEYKELFASSIADMTNAGESSFAGAITAALFLERFTSKDIPWAHFDIMAWNLSNRPGKPKGGEAMGIRAVGHYIKKKYQKD